MSEQINDPNTNTPLRITLILVILLTLLLMLAFFLLRTQARPLMPIQPTPTNGTLTVSDQPIVLTFTELNSDPKHYVDQFIRVTGSYTPLSQPNCSPYNGPLLVWALINEGLQMDAQGFESILRFVPPNQALMVEGIWRVYHGPFGCGKEPTTGNAWYLEVTQVIQPNPIFNPDGTPITTNFDIFQEPVTTIDNDLGDEPTITATPTISAQVTITNTPVLSTTAIPTPTPTVIQLGATFTPTPDAVSTEATPTNTITTTPSRTPSPTPSHTPDGTPDSTPTSTPTSTETAVPNNTSEPPPPPPTPPPGGYSGGGGY